MLCLFYFLFSPFNLFFHALHSVPLTSSLSVLNVLYCCVLSIRYLHTLFTRIPEQYNTQPEYSEYHTMQIPLYAQFAPAFKRSDNKENKEIKSFNEKLHGNNSSNIISNKNSNLSSQAPGTSSFSSSSSSSSSSFSSSSSTQRQQVVDSDFLIFLKKSNFAPLEIALKECEKRKPPLYLEMIFILGKIGEILI